MGYIYKIINDINNKVYIGQTHNSIASRWRSHKRYAEFSTAPLYRAMRKYGIEHFHIEPIEECPQADLDDREIYWIEQYGTYGNKGYNATKGGKGHRIYEEDDIKALWDKGYNIRKICREMNITPNTVKRILGDYQPFIEQREQRYIEASLDKGYESLPVKQYSLDGKFIKEYPSIAEAERQTGTDKTTIVRVCKGASHYANGYQWRYKEDDTPVKQIKTHLNAVLQIKGGKVIQRFESIAKASRQTGFDKNMIRLVAQNGKEHKGYHWKYADEELSAYWKAYYDNLPPKKRKPTKRIYARGAEHPKSKAVIRVSPDGNTTIYESLSEAGKAMGNVNFAHSISRYIGKNKMYKGYYWRKESK